MNDQNHPNAVRLQSSAIVVAALITTIGAVTAACIQTGIFGKPVAISALPSPPEFAQSSPTLFAPAPVVENPSTIPAPVAKASFVGTIEPVEKHPPIVAKPISYSTSADKPLVNKTFGSPTSPAAPANSAMPSTSTIPSASPPAAFQSSQQTNRVYYPSIAEPTAIPNTAIPLPTMPSSDDNVKVLNSPWTYLAGQPSGNQSAEAPKPAKKFPDWSAVTRFFSGHN